MSDEVKKISFGFSKLAKPKTTIISNSKNVKSDDSVQFIDCVEDKSIKVKDEPLKKPEFLVIPLPKQSVADSKRRELLHKILMNNDDTDAQNIPLPADDVSTPAESNKIESLDEIAAREIIEDLKKVKSSDDNKQDFTVPLNADSLAGGKEATLDDYESIPIDKFGVAMLRGMGWAPGKGIGKTEQVISAKQPLLRPKGLGLGADRVIKVEKSAKVDEPLKLIKGSYVRIVAGAHENLFGEVIGFDDETGRLIVKMALGGSVLTFNEFMVEVISKDDFNKNSKVINVKKYEEYKLKESAKGLVSIETENKPNDLREQSTKRSRQSHSRRSSESSLDSSQDRNSTQRKPDARDRSSSPERFRKKNSSRSNDVSRKNRSPEISPEKYRSKHNSRDDYRKERISNNSPEHTKRDKYHSHDAYKEYSKKKKYRSSSEESSKKYKHVSRKESIKRTKSTSSDSSSSDSYSRKKDSKVASKSKKRSSSSDYSSGEERSSKKKHRSDYKKKCKKNKEKKKSRRRSRSYSGDRKRKSSPRKHKKSKHYDS